MPDSRGKLTAEEVKSVENWLKERLESGAQCQICGNSPLSIGEYTFAPPVISKGGGILLKTSVPFVSVDCENCGHTLLFSAVKLGLFEYVRGTLGGPLIAVVPLVAWLLFARTMWPGSTYLQLAAGVMGGGTLVGLTYWVWVIPPSIKSRVKRVASGRRTK